MYEQPKWILFSSSHSQTFLWIFLYNASVASQVYGSTACAYVCVCKDGTILISRVQIHWFSCKIYIWIRLNSQGYIRKKFHNFKLTCVRWDSFHVTWCTTTNFSTWSTHNDLDSRYVSHRVKGVWSLANHFSRAWKLLKVQVLVTQWVIQNREKWTNNLLYDREPDILTQLHTN